MPSPLLSATPHPHSPTTHHPPPPHANTQRLIYKRQTGDRRNDRTNCPVYTHETATSSDRRSVLPHRSGRHPVGLGDRLFSARRSTESSSGRGRAGTDWTTQSPSVGRLVARAATSAAGRRAGCFTAQRRRSVDDIYSRSLRRRPGRAGPRGPRAGPRADDRVQRTTVTVVAAQ